jgi:hypothetical protein
MGGPNPDTPYYFPHPEKYGSFVAFKTGFFWSGSSSAIFGCPSRYSTL